MEKYQHMFDTLGSILNDIQTGFIESEDDSQHPLLYKEYFYLRQVVVLLQDARECKEAREQVEKES